MVLLKAIGPIAFAVATVSCAAPLLEPNPEMLREAEALCLDGRFVEAEPLLREYLRTDLDNAVAHYYLGRCYLSGDLVNLELARGEITAALALFAEHGQRSPQDRFTDEYFELMCITDIGKTYLSEIALTVPRMQPRARRVAEVQARIERCEALYERAAAINPDNHLTKWLRKHVDDVKRAMDRNGPRSVDW